MKTELKRYNLTKYYEKKYENMTYENRHSELLVMVAKDFGLTDLQNEGQAILDDHNKVGYLSSENYTRRNKLYVNLLAVLEQNLPENDYQRLYGCF